MPIVMTMIVMMMMMYSQCPLVKTVLNPNKSLFWTVKAARSYIQYKSWGLYKKGASQLHILNILYEVDTELNVKYSDESSSLEKHVLCLTVQDTVHGGWEVKTVRACSSWSCCICSQRADRGWSWTSAQLTSFLLAHSPGSSAQGTARLVSKMSLPLSLNQDIPTSMRRGLLPRWF